MAGIEKMNARKAHSAAVSRAGCAFVPALGVVGGTAVLEGPDGNARRHGAWSREGRLYCALGHSSRPHEIVDVKRAPAPCRLGQAAFTTEDAPFIACK